MNTDYPNIPWVDPNFLANRRRFPPEELLRLAGQHIAWSWDGTQILAAAPDRQMLTRKLHDAGIDPGRVVFDYLDAPEVTSRS